MNATRWKIVGKEEVTVPVGFVPVNVDFLPEDLPDLLTRQADNEHGPIETIIEPDLYNPGFLSGMGPVATESFLDCRSTAQGLGSLYM